MTRRAAGDALSSVVAWAAARWPFPVDPDPAVDRACSRLGRECDGEAVARASATVGCVAGGVAAAVLAVTVGLAAAATGGLLVACTVAAGGRRLPVLLAAFARTRAVAEVTTLVGSLALSMRLTPVPERAVRVATAAGDGALRRSLRRHARRAAVTGGTAAGLPSFAAEWREEAPALERATALLVAAGDAAAGVERERLLDRAVDAVETDLRDRAASFAGDLRGPVTGLYAFGVLLPLALVGTLPAAVAAGVPVSPLALVVVYDLLLPAAIVVAGGRLLLDRPVAVPSARVDRSHPDVPDRRPHAVVACTAAGATGYAIVTALVAGWAGIIAAIGVGVGSGLVVLLAPARGVRESIDERERGLADALALLGRRVADGESVERALPAVAGTLSGPVADALATAARRRSGLGLTVPEALAGDGGPLEPDRGGPRTRAAVAALATATDVGRPAGAALVAHADRLDALAAAERAARRELATVTGTLRDTAALFGPLVGGATVALAGRLDRLGGGSLRGGVGTALGDASEGAATGADATAAGAASTAVLPPSVVGPAVGAYVLVLAATLTALATGLERGLDATVVGYRAGIALLSATAAFLAGHVAVAALL
ncbi:type II secretion system protein [Halobaculum sp. CBA1158]|uniref:type II secretion system protein n=1 Tax=Halobaculum sp. CBA1158 TaxID=2904243 RepID=UPI001F184FF8|nr:type II secretion system protein [Halobaculum sp. CBA1158]UIP01159.1 type II secretion system protein [Halobaculum sp. CBA1158]